MNDLTDILKRLEELEAFKRSIESAPEMSPLVTKSIGLAITSTSGKTALSATVTVNESGSSIKDVMTAPDGFISIGGKNVPYID